MQQCGEWPGPTSVKDLARVTERRQAGRQRDALHRMPHHLLARDTNLKGKHFGRVMALAGWSGRILWNVGLEEMRWREIVKISAFQLITRGRGTLQRV
jgi:hypothetical protein